MSDTSISRLLVLCARPGSSKAASDETHALAAGVRDWGPMLAAAEEEGLLPLLYWSLRESPGPVPSEVMETLGRAYLRQAARSAAVYRGIEPFLESVKRAGLRAAVTKGARLALDIYPDHALRPFWDVDLVVQGEDWPAVADILEREGFMPPPGQTVGRSDPGSIWTFSPYFLKDSLVLEFHTGSLGLMGLAEEEDFWPACCRLKVRGTEAMVLPAERELCHLAVHAQQHSYRRLIWLADIAEFASRPGLSWERTVLIARKERVAGPVFHALRLVEALWPGTVPPEPVEDLRPGALERRALHALWPETAVGSQSRKADWPYAMPTLFSLWERRSVLKALGVLRDILFPPRAWMAATTRTPAGSPRLVGRYIARILKPFGAVLRRLASG